MSGGRFLGSRDRPDDAQVILLGVPLDLTSSLRMGTREGPQQIREASPGLEEFSMALRRDLREVAFYDQGDLELSPGDLSGSLKRIGAAGAEILGARKRFFALGGEHLITLPLVEVLLAHHPDLILVHFDAHADLADTYAGERLTHATVMRRLAELLGPGRLIQCGIRSATAEELQFATGHTRILEGGPEALTSVRPLLEGRPVYVSVDIDVMDPAFAPGVSTPEAGGWSSRDIFEALALLDGLRVVGMDLVEVCPPYDPSGVTSFLAAKIVREGLLRFFWPGTRPSTLDLK